VLSSISPQSLCVTRVGIYLSAGRNLTPSENARRSHDGGVFFVD